MKRIGCKLAVSAVVVASALAAVAQSESLGDYARAVRLEKRLPAKKLYTNDNLPTTTTISVVGPSATTEEKPAEKPQDEKEKPEQKKDVKTPENKAPQGEQAWQDQIAAQKKKIADLEHELDLLQREYKLQVANYYADAGTQLRDQKNWADQEAKFRADISDKQKQIDEAKAQLQDLEEQARKEGTSGSTIQ